MGFFSKSTWASNDAAGAGDLPKCGACGLYKLCHSPKMAVAGEGRRRILVIGEAPGETEDNQGAPFVGKAGQLLRRLMANVGIDLDDCWMTNAAICRPPDNEIKDVHIESCRPNILRLMRELRPRVVILLGASAVRSLIPTEWHGDLGSITRWVGWRIPSFTHRAWLCPTYHPSFLLRSNEDEVLVRLMEDHLRQAAELEGVKPRGFDLEAAKATVLRLPDPRDTRRRLKDLAARSGLLAFDYETTGLKPERAEQRIVTASFCLNGEETWAGAIDESCHKWLSEVLLNKRLRKIASNLKFEERWTRKKLGHGVAGWVHDTMLAAHVHQNRTGVTSVKFQAYVLLGTGSYSTFVDDELQADHANDLNRIDQIHIDDLLLYNGIDSLVEYKVTEVQRRELGYEPA